MAGARADKRVGGRAARAALALLLLPWPSPAGAAGLPAATWPAGTFLSWVPDSGQVVTLHRGVLYLGGKTQTAYYDVSDPTAPRKLGAATGGNDGHLWWKIGDLFSRDYSEPAAEAAGVRFLDLSGIPAAAPWSGPSPFVTLSTGSILSDMRTFPHVYDPSMGKLYDVRTGQAAGDCDSESQKGMTSTLALRIGSLWFYVGREGYGDGLSAFDVGDPAHPRLLDVLHDDFRQYTAFVGVWRNLIFFMHGDDTNGGGNMVAVDYSDPANLKVAFRLPSSVISASRYVNFQDQYAFAGRFNKAVKFNLESMQVERTFAPPAPKAFPDFQMIPLGPLLVISGSEGTDGGTFLYSHQDGPDATPPMLGYHVPADGAVNQPLGTVVGLVINETLDDTTLNDRTIQITPVGGGTPLACDVVSGEDNVVNVAPRAPLSANATYEVKLVEGGIKDVSGNGMHVTTFRFSTGDAVNPDRPPVVSDVAMTPASPVAAGSAVTFTATAADPEGFGLQYKWDFGDGTVSDWGMSGDAATHAYAAAGSYTALVQARDPGGNVSGRALGLTVSAAGADASVAAQDARSRGRSGPIAVDGGRRWAWISNPDADTVTAMDLDSMSVVREIPVGKRPMGLTFDGQGRAWVACRDSDEVRVLNWNGTSAATIALPRGSRPVSVAMNPAGTTAYVAEYATGRVRRIDVNTFANTGSLDLGPGPMAMAVTEDGGKLLVSRFISSDGGGEVRVVELASFAVSGTIALPVDATTADTAATGRGVPNYVSGLALEPGSGAGWYAAKKDNILKGLARDGTPLGHDSTVRALVGTFDVPGKAEDVSRRADLDNGAQPSAVLVDPYGAAVFVGLMGNNRVLALDRRTGDEVVRSDVGLAPQGMGLDPVTNRLWVEDFMGRTVTVLDAEALIKTGARSLPKLRTIPTVGAEKLSPQALLGKRVFYNAEDPRMSGEGYVSCAVCHLDGGHDGRTWDFTDRGEGLRNTVPMRGRGGMAQGRVHWSGNFDEVQDFENDIRGPFGGTGFMADGAFKAGTRSRPLGDPKAGTSSELDALAAYVATLAETAPSPYKNQDGTLTAQAQDGKAVFVRQNCAACHMGGAFTDSPYNQLHDVGTLKAASGKRLNGPLPGLDTPTLKGLWDTAPYLHDGSAATLADVFNAPNNAKHGRMDRLTAQEKADLAEYLSELDDGESAPTGPAVIALAGVTPEPGAAANVYRVRAAAVPAVTAVEVLVNGVDAGSAAGDGGGRYEKVLTLPMGAVTVQARAARADGGSTFSAETTVGSVTATPAGVNPAVPPDAGERVLTPGNRDGTNDAADFGADTVRVEVSDARGRRMGRWDGSLWDGTDGAGRAVPSGLYIIRAIGADGKSRFRKVLVVK